MWYRSQLLSPIFQPKLETIIDVVVKPPAIPMPNTLPTPPRPVATTKDLCPECTCFVGSKLILNQQDLGRSFETAYSKPMISHRSDITPQIGNHSMNVYGLLDILGNLDRMALLHKRN